MGLCQPRIGRLPVVALVLGLALAVGPLPFAAQPARAATLTVNTVGDGPDLKPSDGFCDTAAEPGVQCSLRAAIQVANATQGADTIAFSIPGNGVRTIQPNSNLPVVTGETTIDGYTQSGSRPNTATVGTNAVLLIELDGSNAGVQFADGLDLAGNNSLVRGLVINRFSDAAVNVATNVTGVRIAGCFVGTNADGTQARPNTFGLAASNARAITIGGPALAARNLISGNQRNGLNLDFSTNSQVLGNLIGTDKSGSAPLGNKGDGIVSSSTNVTIGGAAPGRPNTIAFNGGDGVAVDNDFGSSNRILVNSIFSNGGLGIDLGGNGRTPNDPRDPDPGANFRQNFPVITSATPNRVAGTLNSNPNRTFTLRFFSNPGSGDEGRDFVAKPLTVTTNAAGNASFVFRPTSPLPVGRSVTATATRDDGQTSEFSDPKSVTGS